MEATGYSYDPDQVHVLRHSFRPNEPFQAALANLTTTGPSGPRSFSIYGSDERVVELNDLAMRETKDQIREADRSMATKQHSQLELRSGIVGRILNPANRDSAALQLVMKPLNYLKYAQVSEVLNIVKASKAQYALGFEATRLYLTIPFNQLKEVDEVKEGIAQINSILEDDSTRHIYRVSPTERLIGHDASRTRPEFKKYTPKKERAS